MTRVFWLILGVGLIGSESFGEDLNRFFSRVKQNDIHAVLQMLSADISPDSVDGLGWTALHHAADMGHLEMCRLLLSKGANARAIDPGGTTPLHRAAFQGHGQVLALLLQAGARVDATDGDGRTPLHLAVMQGQREIVRLLLDAGAVPNLLDKAGDTPLDLVQGGARERTSEVAQLLLQKGGKTGARVRAEALSERRRRGLLSQCPGFQGATWGMTRDEVLVEFEDAKMTRDSADLALKTSVGGMPALALLRFFSGRLGAVSVVFEGVQHERGMSHKGFDKLAALLEEKYGPPWTSVRSPKAGCRFCKQDPDYAIAIGELALQATWETQQATIILSCRGLDFRPALTLEYRSLAYFKAEVESVPKSESDQTPRDDL